MVDRSPGFDLDDRLAELSANRMARTAWALLSKGEDYKDPVMAVA